MSAQDKQPSQQPESTSSPAAHTQTASYNSVSDDYYFDSYSHFGIHQEMLQDSVRTETYMRSILENKHLFKDKIVLDVGCGTGILCMFAAKAGAKRVIGMDCSNIIDSAKIIIKDNGFEDKITLLKGKVEDLSLPDGIEKVDIIISEWMGYFLLYESMLDTVLVARDKWLAPGGALFPDKASLYISAIEDQEYRDSKIDYWDNVYGFKMLPLKEQLLEEPMVDIAYKEQVMSKQAKILDIDLYTVKAEDLDFTQMFELPVTRNDVCHALIAYFSCDFSRCVKPTRFHTSPAHTKTHWRQTIFYLTEPLTCNEGETIKGVIDVRRNARNPRDLDIQLKTRLAVDDGRGEPQSKLYKLQRS